MRQSLLEELAPEKADGSEPLTTDEFEALLKQFKQKYSTIDGKESVPMTMNGENMGRIWVPSRACGVKTYYDNNGRLQYDVKDPKYREMLLYMNRLYREGLIEKEFAISKTQTWIQKLTTGAVFSTPGAYWDPGNGNAALKKDGGEKNQLFAYKVVAPGVDPAQTTFGPRSSLGWDAIAITKNNKHPEETMKLFNYLASDEGQHLLLWGKEGEQYTMVDGKRQPDPAFLQSFKDNWDETVKTSGVRKWLWFIKMGWIQTASHMTWPSNISAAKWMNWPSRALAIRYGILLNMITSIRMGNTGSPDSTKGQGYYGPEHYQSHYCPD